MARHGKGEIYVNFAGTGIPDSVRASYPPQSMPSSSVKDQYDPFNLFRFNINIQPTK